MASGFTDSGMKLAAVPVVPQRSEASTSAQAPERDPELCEASGLVTDRSPDVAAVIPLCGPYRARTDDIHGVNVALYQLS